MALNLRLHSIVFERTTPAGQPAALPVRRAAKTAVAPVDWLRGVDDARVNPAIAYTRSPRADGELAVTVTFAPGTLPAGPIFVRALDNGDQLLGNVTSGKITGALTAPHRLSLEDVGLDVATVGERQVQWDWQVSQDGVTWTPFDQSTHRVFVTLGEPAPPWGRPGEAHTVTPWLEPLRTACIWAKGLKDQKAAIKAITARVNGLGTQSIGGRPITYGGFPMVTTGKLFLLDFFMKALSGDPGAPTCFNCADLNTAVAIFSAMIGCGLRVLHLEPKSGLLIDRLRTNPIKLFGARASSSESFGFHEIATLTAQGTDTHVWDACLQIDFDSHPEQGPPANFALPIGVAMDSNGDPEALGYKVRLLQPAGRHCSITLVDGDGLRYPNEVPLTGPFSVAVDAQFDRRRQQFDGIVNLVLGGIDETERSSDAEEFLASIRRPDGFKLPLQTEAGEVQFSPLRFDNAYLNGQVLHARSRRDAVDAFVRLVASYAGLLIPCPIGDCAFYGERFDEVIWLRGTIVTEIHAWAASGVPALQAARDLDRDLASFYPSTTLNDEGQGFRAVMRS